MLVPVFEIVRGWPYQPFRFHISRSAIKIAPSVEKTLPIFVLAIFCLIKKICVTISVANNLTAFMDRSDTLTEISSALTQKEVHCARRLLRECRPDCFGDEYHVERYP